MSAVRRRWHPRWLAVSALGVFVAWQAMQNELGRCNEMGAPCDDWGFFFAEYLPVVGVSELGGPFAIAAALVIAGIAGSLGLMAGPLRLASAAAGWLARVWSGSTKIKWALSIAALWGFPFVYGLYVFTKPPTGAIDPIGSAAIVGFALMAGSLIAFVVTAIIVWLVMFVASVVIRRVRTRSGQPSS